jgi:hypothetical protein
MVIPIAPINLQVPEPGPGVHRLLAAVGNLLGPQSVQPGRKWNRSLPAGTRQPIERDNVVIYDQYILAGSSSAGAVLDAANIQTNTGRRKSRFLRV